jgi:hypothetical protein
MIIKPLVDDESPLLLLKYIYTTTNLFPLTQDVSQRYCTSHVVKGLKSHWY